MNGFKRVLACLILTLLVGTATLAASDRWIHVRVESWDGGPENVSINVPLDMVESMLPLIGTDEFHDGRIHLDDLDIDGIDLPAMLQALQDAPDAEFVTVQTEDQHVRVAKEDGYLKVVVEGRRSERVRVMMPMAVVEALVGRGGNELDVAAALHRLADFDGDLVTVDSDEGTVRVWIDGSESGE